MLAIQAPLTESTLKRPPVPANYVSLRDPIAVKAVNDDLENEVKLGRMAGPFAKEEVLKILGPIRSAPISVIPKQVSTGAPPKNRIVEDYSKPEEANAEGIVSINSKLPKDLVKNRWPNRERMKEQMRNLPPGAMAMGADAKDGFKQIGIHPDVRPHHCVSWNEAIYIRLVASFGARTTPAIFCNLVDATLDAVVAHFEGDLIAFNEMDDFLFIRLIESITEEQVLRIPLELGWQLHPEKRFSWLNEFLYAGIWWNLKELTMRIPEKKRLKYWGAVVEFLARDLKGERFRLDEVQSLVGYLGYATMTRREMRSELHHFYKFERCFASNPRRILGFPPATQRALLRWEKFFSTPDITGSFAHPPTVSPLQISSDASDTGLGIVIDDFVAAFRLEKGWREKLGADIGAAESWAVETALDCAIELGAKDCHLKILCDNTGFVGSWRKGWSRNLLMNKTIARLNQKTEAWGVILELEYVASASNPADAPSQGVIEKGLRGFEFEVPTPRGVAGGLPP